MFAAAPMTQAYWLQDTVWSLSLDEAHTWCQAQQTIWCSFRKLPEFKGEAITGWKRRTEVLPLPWFTALAAHGAGRVRRARKGDTLHDEREALERYCKTCARVFMFMFCPHERLADPRASPFLSTLPHVTV